MFTTVLRYFFSPSVLLATKLSRLLSPEPVAHPVVYRRVARFQTSSRRRRRIS